MFSLCYTTVPSTEVAELVAGKLVGDRVAACVSALPGVTSTYMWKGAVERSTEQLLMIKTQTALVPRVIEAIRSVHPYEVPEIISVPIANGHEPYLEWIRSSTIPCPPKEDKP